MCLYSSVDGLANTFHLVHLGAFATGGAAVVITEATAVSPEGRITPQDLGLYNQKHVEVLKPITEIIRDRGAIAGIQLAHAGRKASTYPPGSESGALRTGGWQTLGPSAIPFNPHYPVPKAMTLEDIAQVTEQFALAARRAVAAGFELIEIHAAHGYLLHEFLSPISNLRTDAYGGSLDSRAKFLLEVVKAIQAEVGPEFPLWVRLSTTDWTAGGFTIEEAIQVSQWLKEAGVHLVDCSSGGNVADAKIPIAPGYQVPLAAAIRNATGISTGAVGLITEPAQAATIVESNQADIVLLAREMLRNPFWPAHAARELGVKLEYTPVQYARAW